MNEGFKGLENSITHIPENKNDTEKRLTKVKKLILGLQYTIISDPANSNIEYLKLGKEKLDAEKILLENKLKETNNNIENQISNPS